MANSLQTLTRSLPRPGMRPVEPATLAASVVISVADEEGNILPLAEEIAIVLNTLPAWRDSYEVIFVDDHSRDGTRDDILQAMRHFPNIRLICHSARYGKSQGIWTGLQHAKGEWVITMDGDGQNDPTDIIKLFHTAEAHGKDANILVSGVRVNRQATLARKLASRFANALRRGLLKDDSPDTGCALKLFRRDTYLALPYFDGIHRYEPALFRLHGHKVVYVPVIDRPRLHGISKLGNLRRAWVGIFDLLGMMWLQNRLHASHEQSVEMEWISQQHSSRNDAAE